MTTDENSSESEFIRKVLATSADKLFDNLKKDENLTREEIENRSIINNHKRGERTKQCLHHAEVVIIWAIFISVVVLGFSYIWHLTTPWSYLSNAQLEKINTVLSSAILASVLSSRFKRYFE